MTVSVTAPAGCTALIAARRTLAYLLTPDMDAARSTLVPRKGMTRAEAEREFGTPAQSSERREGTVTVIILHFVHENEEISAEFVEDVLIRYATQSR